MMMIRRWWLAGVAALLLIAGAAVLFVAPDDTPLVEAPRAAHFVFTDWGGPHLPVYYQLPDKITPDTPVVFVMHGVKRDADRYRDEWAALARQNGFIVIVPQFSQADFPGSRGYNTGYFAARDDTPRPRALWSFAAIEPLFDDVRKRFGTQVPRYTIYGHSAGAQFVHRFVLFMPEARIDQAIAANAGWYTMPDLTTAFPYGLDQAPVDDQILAQALGKRMTVLLGTADTQRDDPNLRKTPEADAQGTNRFLRGQQYFAQAQRAAALEAIPFGWRLMTVPNVGHENGKMAKAAASLIAPK